MGLGYGPLVFSAGAVTVFSEAVVTPLGSAHACPKRGFFSVKVIVKLDFKNKWHSSFN